MFKKEQVKFIWLALFSLSFPDLGVLIDIIRQTPYT